MLAGNWVSEGPYVAPPRKLTAAERRKARGKSKKQRKREKQKQKKRQKKQAQRSQTFYEFNSSPKGILICTDVAARGPNCYKTKEKN